jgi:hypothetical protein
MIVGYYTTYSTVPGTATVNLDLEICAAMPLASLLPVSPFIFSTTMIAVTYHDNTDK